MLSKFISWIKDHQKALRIIFSLVLLFFLGLVVWKIIQTWHSVNWEDFQVQLHPVLYYLLLTTGAYAFFVWSWQFSLRVLNERITYRSASIIYLKSQLGKYIPGKVGLIITKIVEAQKKGITVRHATIASSLELALQLYIMLLIGVLATYFVGREVVQLSVEGFYFAVFVLLLLVFFFTPGNYFRLINQLLSLIKREPIEEIRGRDFYLTMLLKLAGVLVNGVAMFFAIRVIHPLGFEHLLFVISASTLAFLIGLVAVFAPSGVGIRDAILIYLLSVIMPPPIALVAAVVIRILAVVSELLLVGLAYFLDTKKLAFN